MAGALGGAALVYLLVNRALSAPRYSGQTTDHFDGRKFHNLEGPERRGFLDFLRWQFTGRRGEWNKWNDSEPGAPPPMRMDGEKLRITFINHATVCPWAAYCGRDEIQSRRRRDQGNSP